MTSMFHRFAPVLALAASQLVGADAPPSNRGDMESTPAAAIEVVEFWRQAGPSLWFAKDAQFDQRFRSRFATAYESAVRGELSSWSSTPQGALAVLILLDQYPRNSFRGTARMYATDGIAREIALRAVDAGFDRQLPPELRLFVYLPFAHSENMADQDRSVALVRNLSATDLEHAEHHRNIIQRFGRFPHRNAILGRVSTRAEQKYLDAGGYKG